MPTVKLCQPIKMKLADIVFKVPAQMQARPGF